MKKEFSRLGAFSSLRNGMLLPVALLIATFVAGCFSYSDARERIADDLNEAIIALVHENSSLWTRQDTIEALRHINEAVHTPLMVQATELHFRNPRLREEAFYTLALVDNNNHASQAKSGLLASDSIMLVPERSADGVAVRVQGFADCSIASVLGMCDPTLPGILLTLSLLSMGYMAMKRRKRMDNPLQAAAALQPTPLLDGIKLTPMQRQLMQMLLDAPGMKVAKATLCETLWDNKSNAEESLYTLVKRTKAALADTGLEITCNRGDSYELTITC